MLRRDNGHILRRLLDAQVAGQWKKGRLKGTWGTQVDDNGVKVGLIPERVHCRS